jgi:hypothetical protein
MPTTAVVPHLCPHERHGACCLREPLVPADGSAQPAELGVPHLEARVTRAEVELLLVAASVNAIV